jgi:peroxin-3
VLLPKILSVLTREAHAIGNGMPNEYLKEMEQVRDLEGFAAVVYSSNWEREMRHDATEDGVGVGTREGGPGMAQPVEESMVVVESQGSFESAWEKATASR